MCRAPRRRQWPNTRSSRSESRDQAERGPSMTKRTDAHQQPDFDFAAADAEPEGTGLAHRATDLAAAGSVGDEWPVDLTRRLRVLLHTLPLDGVRRGDAIRDAELR